MNTNDEVVVATVDVATHEAKGEKELEQQISEYEFKAESIIIKDDNMYEQACEFGKLLKQKEADVTSLFKPMKDAANKAHKAVCDREKAMMTPLKNAEAIVKKSVGNYLAEKERIRIELEAEARKRAEEEAQKKLEEAVSLDKKGDAEEADNAMNEAIIAQNAAQSIVVQTTDVKVKGVSNSKDWEITGIDESKVPVTISGITIRPVDEKAIMKLIRASKGQIKIEGISYKETVKMSFRR